MKRICRIIVSFISLFIAVVIAEHYQLSIEGSICLGFIANVLTIAIIED